MTSWKKPTDEQIQTVLSSSKKEIDRQFFYTKLKNPLWIKPLVDHGVFKSPPELISNLGAPFWPELNYLKNVYKEVPDEVVEVILSIPKTDNHQVYDGILEIALGLSGDMSVKLLPKILEYTGIENRFSALRYSELLAYWAKENQIHAAIQIAERLLPFEPDPNNKSKKKRRKKNPGDWGTLLDPSPRFDKWEYCEILEKGIRPLAEREPYQIAHILLDATSSMIQLSKHEEELEKCDDEDSSEAWCRRLDDIEDDYYSSKEILINTLTYACEKVYELSPEFVDSLDQLLRNQRWKVFKRLRQHLYAKNPSNETLPWIREFILQHREYAKWDHHYEFQFMIRNACEYYGSNLLSNEEQQRIFNEILRGPSEKDFRSLSKDRFTEEAFKKRKCIFHRKQLRPFESILNGEYLRYYKEIYEELKEDKLSDDDYSPMGKSKGGYITNKSPRSVEELEKLNDDELLLYINEWQESHYDKDDLLIHINIEALSEEFKTVFKKNIISDATRFTFWMTNREQIMRPVYVKTIIKAMQELIYQQPNEILEKWFDFCEWVLLHQDIERQDGEYCGDESSENPDWRSSKRAVGDLIGLCVNKDSRISIEAKASLAKLLKLLCTQYDWRLDSDKPVLLNRDDQLTEAINNTRSRGLESLVHYGFWVRKKLPKDPLPELIEILCERLKDNAQFPFKMPEVAILGMHFGNIYTLNKDWAIDNKSKLFQQDNSTAWLEAFGIFLCFNQPNKIFFDIFEADFNFALENLQEFFSKKFVDKEFVSLLGQHIFTYYLWDVYSLNGNDSLLYSFYQKTSGNRQYWAKLFNYVGASLSRSGESLENSLHERCIEFFEWRLGLGEPEELQDFSFWLNAKCLSADWRLERYSEILRISPRKGGVIMSELRALNSLLADNIALVVECFAKITDGIDQNDNYYIQREIGKEIIRDGLKSEEPEVVGNAERARENMLRMGRFDFLDLE